MSLCLWITNLFPWPDTGPIVQILGHISLPNFRTLSPELEAIEPFQTEVVGYWATYCIYWLRQKQEMIIKRKTNEKLRRNPLGN